LNHPVESKDVSSLVKKCYFCEHEWEERFGCACGDSLQDARDQVPVVTVLQSCCDAGGEENYHRDEEDRSAAIGEG
jgi:hypothetical protein